jgi:hypothetical protein
MSEDSAITVIGHVIQLAVAPTFMLTAIGAMLGVMTNRLARIIDRSRVLEVQNPIDPGVREVLDAELLALGRRGKYVNRAITLCTVTALLISSVIAVLFLGAFAWFDAAIIVAVLFVTAMLTLIMALIFFLKEIMIATSSIRIGRRQATHEP